MINFEMINKIKEWGFTVEKEYHRTKAHDGIIGIKDKIITENELFDFCYEHEYYIELDYSELLEKVATETVYCGDYKIYTKYKLYHEDAEKLVTLADYLNDEFTDYLDLYDITRYDWEASDIEEFFEQYGIEVY